MNEDDEFMLNLLNEQSIWDQVILATDDSVAAKKRFLTRTARYGGLLNILDFSNIDMNNKDSVNTLLDGANTWLAFNVSTSSFKDYAEIASKSKLKRALFTTYLPSTRINDTQIPEIQDAIKTMENAGISFTGIRHGSIVDGTEDNSYEIVNATLPLAYPEVERGVLARIVAELLVNEKSYSSECGVSSSGEFASAYLNVLRSSGLDRNEEVNKMFTGGLARVSQSVEAEYERQKIKAEEKKTRQEKEKLEKEEEERNERAVMKAAELPASITPTGPRPLALDPNAAIDPSWDEDKEVIEEALSEEALISKRTEEILQSVWVEIDTRMYAKSTTKTEFFDANRIMARGLAEKEFEEEKVKKELMKDDDARRSEVLERLADVNRKQYSKLLAFERKEMQNQKEISDTWVKYIYLLLEVTMKHCTDNNILFYNLDEYSQTLLLRQKANDLRKQCNLQPFEMIYDPLDASVIVNRLSLEPIGVEYGLSSAAEELVTNLNNKYSKILKSVAALRGASQIIELAIETLKAELPPPPPSVNEMRRAESKQKQQLVSQVRLDAIKNRGKPKGSEDDGVGRL
jgi:hypothetical protein